MFCPDGCVGGSEASHVGCDLADGGSDFELDLALEGLEVDDGLLALEVGLSCPGFCGSVPEGVFEVEAEAPVVVVEGSDAVVGLVPGCADARVAAGCDEVEFGQEFVASDEEFDLSGLDREFGGAVVGSVLDGGFDGLFDGWALDVGGGCGYGDEARFPDGGVRGEFGDGFEDFVGVADGVLGHDDFFLSDGDFCPGLGHAGVAFAEHPGLDAGLDFLEEVLCAFEGALEELAVSDGEDEFPVGFHGVGDSLECGVAELCLDDLAFVACNGDPCGVDLYAEAAQEGLG